MTRRLSPRPVTLGVLAVGALAARPCCRRSPGHTVWDINAVESYVYEYDGYEGLYAPYAYRASDHNPRLVGVDTGTGTPAAGTGRP